MTAGSLGAEESIEDGAILFAFDQSVILRLQKQSQMSVAIVNMHFHDHQTAPHNGMKQVWVCN